MGANVNEAASGANAGGTLQVQLGLAPIIKMLGVTLLVATIIVFVVLKHGLPAGLETTAGDSGWILAHLAHVPQFLIPFVLICFISKGRLREYGFHVKQKPPIFTHRRMFAVGAIAGLLMSLRYIPQIAANAPIDVPRPVTPLSVLGHMSFQWIVVGVSEETMFRGLIQTYLMNHLAGHVRIIGHDLHVGTVAGAIFWGVFHFINVPLMPLTTVVVFVALTTVAGLLMGYAYQQTGSLLTTVIVHNTMMGLPLTVGYILYWLL